jgi:hypothetical protein
LTRTRVRHNETARQLLRAATRTAPNKHGPKITPEKDTVKDPKGANTAGNFAPE